MWQTFNFQLLSLRMTYLKDGSTIDRGTCCERESTGGLISEEAGPIASHLTRRNAVRRSDITFHVPLNLTDIASIRLPPGPGWRALDQNIGRMCDEI